MLSIHEDTWFKRWFNYEAEGRKVFCLQLFIQFSHSAKLAPRNFFVASCFELPLSVVMKTGGTKNKNERDEEFIVSL